MVCVRSNQIYAVDVGARLSEDSQGLIDPSAFDRSLTAFTHIVRPSDTDLTMLPLGLERGLPLPNDRLAGQSSPMNPDKTLDGQ